MTEREIVKAYCEAKDQRAQIGILADMTLMDRDEIKGILRKAGVLVPEKNRRAGKAWTTEELLRLEELFKDGNKISDIANTLDRSEGSAREKLISLGLVEKVTRPSNYWTDEREELFFKLCEKRLPYEEIQKSFPGKSVAALYSHYAAIGKPFGRLPGKLRGRAAGKTKKEAAQ